MPVNRVVMLDPANHAICHESDKDQARMRRSRNAEFENSAKATSSRTSEVTVLLGPAVGKDQFKPVKGEVANVICRPASRIEAIRATCGVGMLMDSARDIPDDLGGSILILTQAHPVATYSLSGALDGLDMVRPA